MRRAGHGEDVPVVYLVRHAHAGKKAQWQGPDAARPLSAQGHKEALGLIAQLDGHPVARVLSSPTMRCLQSVEPLAHRLGRPVEPADALGIDGTGPGVLALLADPTLDHAVLCTHGEVIGKVFHELQQVGLALTHRPQWPKGSTWVLEPDDGHGWKGTYLEPLAVEPASAGGRGPSPR
jgi:broad specificity phosphatase PhoE